MTADAQVITTSDHAPADAHGSGGIGIPVLGMLLFITSEVMFFAGLFAAYFSIRASFINRPPGCTSWPPPEGINELGDKILNALRLSTDTEIST